MKNKYNTREQFHYGLKRAKGIPVHTDTRRYRDFADSVIAARGNNEMEIAAVSAGSGIETIFAAVCETADRKLRLQPYHEQITAGKIMLENNLVQMQTGEGKTLSAVFPAVVNALNGCRTHIFTANEYLARRDCEWMGGIYKAFGIKCSCVIEKMTIPEKKEAYGSSVVYLTAKQAGFDYLHDCLQFDGESAVHRRFEKCIVDEADFILIDEARVPLVIARENVSAGMNPSVYDDISKKLTAEHDFSTDRSGRKCVLTSAGINKVCSILNVDQLMPEGLSAVAGVNVALHAQHLLKKDVDYIVRKDRIELVDELTGRVADKREWPYGIQRALEAKEGLILKSSGEICGTVTIENFISLYPEIAAMTATAETAAAEFYNRYGLETYILQPHGGNNRTDLPDTVFKTKKAKYLHLKKTVADAHESGRPVLIGTSSVLESGEVSALLNEAGIAHNVLNAVNDEEEADIISQAGSTGAVTVSTNMAGRGTDILLGGPDAVNASEIRKTGGLLVISLNRHESKRIDNQLKGRSGRQGDPGQSLFLLSLEDRLFTRYGISEFIPEKIFRFEGDKPINDIRAGREVARAQEIIENQHSKMRETLHNYSMVTEKYRLQLMKHRNEAVYEHIFPERLLSGIEEKLDAYVCNKGMETAERRLTQVFVSSLDEFWISLLDWNEHVREGIHLRRFGKKEPLFEYMNDVEAAYRNGFDKAVTDCIELINSEGLETAAASAVEKSNGSTWTYIIDDNPYPSFTLGLLGMDNAVAAVTGAVLVAASPLLLLQWASSKLKKYIKKS